MNSNENSLILFNEVYNFYIFLTPILKRFPKSEKFTLVKEIKDTLLNIIVDCQKLSYSDSKSSGLKIIKRVSFLFDKLKMLLRLSSDLLFIPKSHYIMVLEFSGRIGKLIGGVYKYYS